MLEQLGFFFRENTISVNFAMHKKEEIIVVSLIMTVLAAKKCCGDD